MIDGRSNVIAYQVRSLTSARRRMANRTASAMPDRSGRIVSEIVGIDQVQPAMPPGEETRARAFYRGVPGLAEEPKPAHLVRGRGVWFRNENSVFTSASTLIFAPQEKRIPRCLFAVWPMWLPAARRTGSRQSG
jgi:hypothetical protein